MCFNEVQRARGSDCDTDVDDIRSGNGLSWAPLRKEVRSKADSNPGAGQLMLKVLSSEQWSLFTQLVRCERTRSQVRLATGGAAETAWLDATHEVSARYYCQKRTVCLILLRGSGDWRGWLCSCAGTSTSSRNLHSQIHISYFLIGSCSSKVNHLL